MKIKTIKTTLISVGVTCFVTACNDTSIPQIPSGNEPPADQPSSFSHTAPVIENTAVTTPLSSLMTSLEDDADSLKLQSTGFPNRIVSITPSNGSTITDKTEINGLFELFIDPQTGSVEVKVKKSFDYESEPDTYELDVQLGNTTGTITVEIWDEQKGTANEPLTISSYNELVSFFNGLFQSENIGRDVIDLAKPNSTEQHLDNLHVQLDRDIDASASAQTPWAERRLHGVFNGQRHVIKNLTIADGASFIDNEDDNSYLKHISVVKNVGFMNARLSKSLINASFKDSAVENVFVSGKVTAPALEAYEFAPFESAYRLSNIYTNLYYDLTALKASTNYGLGVYVNGISGSSGISVRLGAAYSNGSMHMKKDHKVNATLAGISSGFFARLHDPSLGSPVYSAIDFEPSEHAALLPDGSPYVKVGGLIDKYLDYPSGNPEASGFAWRFVTDRNQTGRIQLTGNANRDSNNDGIPDIDGSADNPDLAGAGVTEAELKQIAQFSGPWTAGNSAFDLTEGEYPALKNMPYPRDLNASWMNAADPGVAFQRATFDTYLVDPEL